MEGGAEGCLELWEAGLRRAAGFEEVGEAMAWRNPWDQDGVKQRGKKGGGKGHSSARLGMDSESPASACERSWKYPMASSRRSGSSRTAIRGMKSPTYS